MKLKIAIENKTYEVDVEVLEDETPPSHGSVSPRPFPAVASRTPSASSATASPAVGTAVRALETGPVSNAVENKLIRSPIVGIVAQLTCQEGQEIKVNDCLIVLEAMKMETRIICPISGKIKKIFTRPGEGVKRDQILVEFE